MLTCEETATLLQSWDDILVICHENPDGDALGSMFGLVRGLRAMGRQADWYCASPVPEKFVYLAQGLEHTGRTPAHVLTVDVSDQKLLGDAWFCATQNPELLLAEAMKQSQTKNYHWPAPAYVAAFLLSALGRPEEGLQRLGIWFDREPQISDELKEKLRKQLGKCANVITDDL